MYLDRLFSLTFLSLAGLVAGVSSNGFLKNDYTPVQSGDGQARRPRFILGRGTDIDLSISYDSFFTRGGHNKLNQKLGFNQVSMYFGNHKVTEGDKLCSFKEDGTFFLIKKSDRYRCRKGFGPLLPQEIRLPNLNRAGTIRSSSSSIPDFYIPSCSFTLKEISVGTLPKKWSITMNNCKMYSYDRNISIAPITFEVKYEVN